MSDDQQPIAPARTRKPSRFDRPKPPRDWRWVVGGIGRVLISLGILMFLFVAYQLWGTGIQTAQAQNRLENQFNDLLASTTSAVTTTTTTDPTPDTGPVTSEPVETGPVAPGLTVSAPPIPTHGDPLARLKIPTIDVDVIVVEGVKTPDLKKGPGHFPETVFPGQFGNAAIAGHRTTYGAPFYEIQRLQPGHELIVTTLAGRYVYRVTGTEIIGAGDYASVIPTVDDTKATLVLVSCHPRYTAKQRIVVFSELVPEQSSPLSVREILSSPDLQPDEELPGDSIPDDSVPDDSVPPATTPTADPGASDDTAAGEDAFAGGWFADKDAWPQVALWGVVLSLVALGAYGISRLARRNWVGALVGIGPFLFVLYFWFENVNRLLPAGI